MRHLPRSFNICGKTLVLCVLVYEKYAYAEQCFNLLLFVLHVMIRFHQPWLPSYCLSYCLNAETHTVQTHLLCYVVITLAHTEYIMNVIIPVLTSFYFQSQVLCPADVIRKLHEQMETFFTMTKNDPKSLA